MNGGRHQPARHGEPTEAAALGRGLLAPIARRDRPSRSRRAHRRRGTASRRFDRGRRSTTCCGSRAASHGEPSGHGYGSVSRISVSPVIAAAAEDDEHPLERCHRLAPHEHRDEDDHRVRAGDPGPRSAPSGGTSSSGRSGWTITSIDHCRLSAASPPPTAHSATSHDTGCRPRASSAEATAPKTIASAVSTRPYHWPTCQRRLGERNERDRQPGQRPRRRRARRSTTGERWSTPMPVVVAVGGDAASVHPDRRAMLLLGPGEADACTDQPQGPGDEGHVLQRHDVGQRDQPGRHRAADAECSAHGTVSQPGHGDRSRGEPGTGPHPAPSC